MINCAAVSGSSQLKAVRKLSGPFGSQDNFIRDRSSWLFAARFIPIQAYTLNGGSYFSRVHLQEPQMPWKLSRGRTSWGKGDQTHMIRGCRSISERVSASMNPTSLLSSVTGNPLWPVSSAYSNLAPMTFQTHQNDYSVQQQKSTRVGWQDARAARR